MSFKILLLLAFVVAIHCEGEQQAQAANAEDLQKSNAYYTTSYADGGQRVTKSIYVDERAPPAQYLVPRAVYHNPLSNPDGRVAYRFNNGIYQTRSVLYPNVLRQRSLVQFPVDYLAPRSVYGNLFYPPTRFVYVPETVKTEE